MIHSDINLVILERNQSYERINMYESDYVYYVRFKYIDPNSNKEVYDSISNTGSPISDNQISSYIINKIADKIQAEAREKQKEEEIPVMDKLLGAFRQSPNRLLKIELIRLTKLLLKYYKRK